MFFLKPLLICTLEIILIRNLSEIPVSKFIFLLTSSEIHKMKVHCWMCYYYMRSIEVSFWMSIPICPSQYNRVLALTQWLSILTLFTSLFFLHVDNIMSREIMIESQLITHYKIKVHFWKLIEEFFRYLTKFLDNFSGFSLKISKLRI